MKISFIKMLLVCLLRRNQWGKKLHMLLDWVAVKYTLAQRGPCPSLWERYAYSRKTGERKKFLQSTRKSFILGSTGAREPLDSFPHLLAHPPTFPCSWLPRLYHLFNEHEMMHTLCYCHSFPMLVRFHTLSND